MRRSSNIRWFPPIAVAILVTFLGTMVFAVIKAYSRKSGVTGLDMAQVQLMRKQQPEQNPEENPTKSR